MSQPGSFFDQFEAPEEVGETERLVKEFLTEKEGFIAKSILDPRQAAAIMVLRSVSRRFPRSTILSDYITDRLMVQLSLNKGQGRHTMLDVLAGKLKLAVQEDEYPRGPGGQSPW